ncbi:hypothetical protein C2E23DRAFT_331976 [Lenzites betulinus]|nr:hypothetical protein C2E23DRAFT_331976 [Lenzites betulinus]
MLPTSKGSVLAMSGSQSPCKPSPARIHKSGRYPVSHSARRVPEGERALIRSQETIEVAICARSHEELELASEFPPPAVALAGASRGALVQRFRQPLYKVLLYAVLQIAPLCWLGDVVDDGLLQSSPFPPGFLPRPLREALLQVTQRWHKSQRLSNCVSIRRLFWSPYVCDTSKHVRCHTPNSRRIFALIHCENPCYGSPRALERSVNCAR